jgi:hypothetical protein
MRLDRDGLDRAGLDRTGYFNPFSSPAIFSTGAFEILVNRTYQLDIAATGAIADPLLDRTHLLDFAATGEFALLTDRGLSLAWGATGILDNPLINRTHLLDFSAIGGFDDPGLKRIIDLAFSGTGTPSLDPFLRLISLNFAGTGAYPITIQCPTKFSTVMLDRGSVDRGSEILTCGYIYPVRVDRTFIFDILATGSPTILWTWLKDLTFGSTGSVADPLVNRTIPLSFGATGALSVSSFIPIHYLTADWGATGSFAMGTARSYLVNFGATGHVDTPTSFIPIHYLNQTWGSTGAFVEPWVYRAITNIDKLIVSGKISKSLADKMYSAVFTFDKTTVAGSYSSLFWTKLVFKVPDYAGVFNTIFVGTAPSSSTDFTAAGLGYNTGNQSLKAYDYSWYLAQNLDPAHYVLLTWKDQQAESNHMYNLQYDGSIHPFIVGNRVVGHTSLDSGTIIAIGHAAFYYVTLVGLIGSAPYFQNDEELWVVGTMFARADGSASNAGYWPNGTTTQRRPEDFITEILGGATDWQKVSGIYPYRMKSSTTWWGSLDCAEVEFDFNSTTTKAASIEQICQYMKWVFYVRWKNITPSGGVFTYDVPCAYFVNESDIDLGSDNGLDLPTPVLVTSYSYSGDTADAGRHMISPFKLTQAGEEQYNWYVVRCQSLNGTWYESNSATCPYVTTLNVYDPILNPTGTVQKRLYYEENKNIATQSDADKRVLDLYTYYQARITTWTATFRLRSDFVLLQKLNVAGYNPAITDGTYRIIGIEYDYSNGGMKNEVTVTIIPDNQFRAYLNLKRVFMNSIFEIQNVVQEMMNKIVNHVGYVVSISGTSVGEVGQTVVVIIDGAGGSQQRIYDPTGTLTLNDKVMITLQGRKLIAVKTV